MPLAAQRVLLPPYCLLQCSVGTEGALGPGRMVEDLKTETVSCKKQHGPLMLHRARSTPSHITLPSLVPPSWPVAYTPPTSPTDPAAHSLIVIRQPTAAQCRVPHFQPFSLRAPAAASCPSPAVFRLPAAPHSRHRKVRASYRLPRGKAPLAPSHL